MTARIKKLYDSGCSNKDFLLDIRSADGDTKPNCFADELERHLFATMYYGWLVGKYGNDWKYHVYQKFIPQ